MAANGYRRVSLAPQMHAAARAGRLAAQGLLDETEILPALLLALPPDARRAAQALTLLRVLRQSRAATTEARRHAAARVRHALAPLLAARAGRARLLAAAAAADPQALLLAHERRALAEALVRRALGPRRRRN